MILLVKGRPLAVERVKGYLLTVDSLTVVTEKDLLKIGLADKNSKNMGPTRDSSIGRSKVKGSLLHEILQEVFTCSL